MYRSALICRCESDRKRLPKPFGEKPFARKTVSYRSRRRARASGILDCYLFARAPHTSHPAVGPFRNSICPRIPFVFFAASNYYSPSPLPRGKDRVVDFLVPVYVYAFVFIGIRSRLGRRTGGEGGGGN